MLFKLGDIYINLAQLLYIIPDIESAASGSLAVFAGGEHLPLTASQVEQLNQMIGLMAQQAVNDQFNRLLKQGVPRNG